MIPCIDIIRLASGQGDGTFGKMRFQKEVFADTLEPRDRENHRNISSIPCGQYICKRIISPRFGETFGVTDVTDRDNILFHWGNFDDNTEGCIILGNGIKMLGDRLAVINSKDTFKVFMKKLDPYDSFILTITECY